LHRGLRRVAGVHHRRGSHAPIGTRGAMWMRSGRGVGGGGRPGGGGGGRRWRVGVVGCRGKGELSRWKKITFPLLDVFILFTSGSSANMASSH
jgi:hypothetical protein